MAQVTIYLPDPLAELLRRQAKAQKISLSSFIATALRRALRTEGTAELESLYGSWQGREPIIDDQAPEEREPL